MFAKGGSYWLILERALVPSDKERCAKARALQVLGMQLGTSFSGKSCRQYSLQNIEAHCYGRFPVLQKCTAWAMQFHWDRTAIALVLRATSRSLPISQTWLHSVLKKHSEIAVSSCLSYQVMQGQLRRIPSYLFPLVHPAQCRMGNVHLSCYICEKVIGANSQDPILGNSFSGWSLVQCNGCSCCPTPAKAQSLLCLHLKIRSTVLQLYSSWSQTTRKKIERIVVQEERFSLWWYFNNQENQPCIVVMNCFATG